MKPRVIVVGLIPVALAVSAPPPDGDGDADVGGDWVGDVDRFLLELPQADARTTMTLRPPRLADFFGSATSLFLQMLFRPLRRLIVQLPAANRPTTLLTYASEGGFVRPVSYRGMVGRKNAPTPRPSCPRWSLRRKGVLVRPALNH